MLPREAQVGFRGQKGGLPGIAVSAMSEEQKTALQKVLAALVEPYRKEDKDEALACLHKQGGLDHCALAFYKDLDIGDDGEWDNWRLEGPSFVWYFRGYPHVHIWINVADQAAAAIIGDVAAVAWVEPTADGTDQVRVQRYKMCLPP